MQNPTQPKYIKAKVDVTKLNKSLFFRGKKGIYCDLLLCAKPSEYGDDGFVLQSVSKAQSAAGERGPIVGNWRELSKAKNEPNGEDECKDDGDDDIPF